MTKVRGLASTLLAILLLAGPASLAAGRRSVIDPLPTSAAGASIIRDGGSSILLDGHKIVNMLDDVLAFWETARGKGLKRQRRLWLKQVENKYRDYFERAVYRNADWETRSLILNQFLTGFPDRADAVRQFNKNASQLVLEVIMDFKARFPDYRQLRDIYVGVSLLGFDGTVRSVQNEIGMPDTLCIAADVMSGYPAEQAKVAIAHEFFHLYHFGNLFRGLLGASGGRGVVFHQELLTSLVTPQSPLMIEGMAVAGSEMVYPGHSATSYLHLPEDELAAQEEMLRESSRQYLQLINEGALPGTYDQWFTNGAFDSIPRRGGYLLGYEVTKRVLAGSTLEAMVRMSIPQLAEHAEEQLASMATDKVLLMAGGR